MDEAISWMRWMRWKMRMDEVISSRECQRGWFGHGFGGWLTKRRCGDECAQLYNAAEAGDAATVKRLLARADVDVNHTNMVRVDKGGEGGCEYCAVYILHAQGVVVRGFVGMEAVSLERMSGAGGGEGGGKEGCWGEGDRR